MTRARSTLISLSETPWYHVISRCVRRAYLCGADVHSGQCFEHRRSWIVERVKQLAGVFAIDIAAYAVMSNHYHLVVRVDAQRARGWSDDEVLSRWTKLFVGPDIVRRRLHAGDNDWDANSKRLLVDYVEQYRERLHDLSWFARVLNESIARKANAEDEVTGRFWDGRFKTQALLDHQAVLTAMAYVDLNPIRANIAATPETSEYTSVAERIALVAGVKPNVDAFAQQLIPAVDIPKSETKEARVRLRAEKQLSVLPLQPLMPFDPTSRLKAAIPFGFEAYLELVESTGRCIRPDKRGAISPQVPSLLIRLNIEPDRFIDCAAALLKRFGSAIGAPSRLIDLSVARQVKYLRGISASRAAFRT